MNYKLQMIWSTFSFDYTEYLAQITNKTKISSSAFKVSQHFSPYNTLASILKLDDQEVMGNFIIK